MAGLVDQRRKTKNGFEIYVNRKCPFFYLIFLISFLLLLKKLGFERSFRCLDVCTIICLSLFITMHYNSRVVLLFHSGILDLWYHNIQIQDVCHRISCSQIMFTSFSNFTNFTTTLVFWYFRSSVPGYPFLIQIHSRKWPYYSCC